MEKGYPESKIHGDNMRPAWGRQDPGGPHVGHMNIVIWVMKQINQKMLFGNMSKFVTIQSIFCAETQKYLPNHTNLATDALNNQFCGVWHSVCTVALS